MNQMGLTFKAYNNNNNNNNNNKKKGIGNTCRHFIQYTTM